MRAPVLKHLPGAVAQQHDLGLLWGGVDIYDEFSVAGDSRNVVTFLA